MPSSLENRCFRYRCSNAGRVAMAVAINFASGIAPSPTWFNDERFRYFPAIRAWICPNKLPVLTPDPAETGKSRAWRLKVLEGHPYFGINPRLLGWVEWKAFAATVFGRD
ncbi:MAG: hypothetical protein ACTHLN_10815, partial [Tepidisphaeraceae bacterium]